MPCYTLPELYGIDSYIYTEGSWDINPEWSAFEEKECGAIPEGENKASYHYDRYENYMGDGALEAAMYFSEEVFDPENYNDNSIKKESKIAF